MRLVLAHVKMGRWIPKRRNPFPSGPRCTWDVLLESRRNGSARTISIRRGGWRRGVRAAVAPGEGAAAPGASAWSWGGDVSPIYGEAGGRIGWRGRGDVTLPVSLHGSTTAGSGRARAVDGHRRVCGASGCERGSRLAVVGGRQVHGRTNDFTDCGTGSTGWRTRLGVLWFSVACAQPAGNETSGPPREGFNADAVPTGNAGYARRSPVVAARVCEAGHADDVARY